MKGLLVTTAVLEAATGVALLALPTTVISLLLGASLDTSGEIAISRITGAATLSLGLACWSARHDSRTRPGRGVITAILVYNVAVAAILAHAALGLGLTGIGLWPAVALHMALAFWCIASLRSG